MKLTKAAFLLALLVIFFLFLPFILFLNKKAAYYSYKEVVYKTVINNLIGQEKDQKKICLLLLDYFHYELLTPYEEAPIDKDVYSDLIRGIAWCDQRSWGLGTFLGKLGINNRIVSTRNPKGISNHTILEVFIDGKWTLFDPMYGFVLKDDTGELASYEDVCAKPYLYYLSPSMMMLKEINYDKYQEIKDYFTDNIFHNHPSGPIFHSDPTLNKDFKRRIISKVLNSYIYLFGNKFSYFYQDIYLKYFSPSDKRTSMFFKARNYDIFNRRQLAIGMYKTYLDNYPKDTNLEDALFFLGILHNKASDFQASISTLQILLRDYPKTKWRRLARYYLGYDYELLNNYKLAKQYYWEAIGLYRQVPKGILMPGELKIIRRLYGLLDQEK
ncbi:MAG: tetratricopeptide repeat protein [Candidatus Omnitrophota bacterium]